MFVSVALAFGLALELSGVLERQELQLINRRFEARQWLVWSKESLERLNPIRLWDYHEAHEMPKVWWFWDYTLSWLLENNHPPVQNKIVIFNHLFDDEPPADVVEALPWMKPLLSYPESRQTVADMVEFIAKAGARAIILDNDFPQYSPDDKALAEVIHNCSVGKYGKIIPVFMVRAINRRASGPLVQLEVPTSPSGVLSELSKLEGRQDLTDKYTGMTTINQDKDQVVRQIQMRLSSAGIGQSHESVILKVMKATNQKIPETLPDIMDIDFASPPNSSLYPVRPINYLLDPEQRKNLLGLNPQSRDVTIKNAIVLIGNGITDVYSTPLTNDGLNQMSGTEILAHALETVSRQSWPQRLDKLGSAVYLLVCTLIGGMLWILWKSLQQSTAGTLATLRSGRLVRLLSDIFFLVFLLVGNYLAACVIFADYRIIVPILVPSVGLAFGTLAAIVWEREREKEETFTVRLEAAQEKLTLERENFESELGRMEAETRTREMLVDRQRRQEFVRRINHDLNAPVSVLNWTIAELQMMEIDNAQAKDKVSRLVKASDKLCELIDQLVQSYDYRDLPGTTNNQASMCELAEVLDDCVDGQKPLAEKYKDTIHWQKPDTQHFVKANSLELTRVVDNLIRNAIKHNPHQTEIFVSLESNGSFHNIRIADSGTGISPEHLNHIFEPGYRVNPNKVEGHGLGLDIAKTLVESMGGEISVTSTLTKGTTFKIKFPASGDLKAAGDHQLADKFDDQTNYSLDDQLADQEETLENTPTISKQALEVAKQGTGE